MNGALVAHEGWSINGVGAKSNLTYYFVESTAYYEGSSGYRRQPLYEITDEAFYDVEELSARRNNTPSRRSALQPSSAAVAAETRRSDVVDVVVHVLVNTRLEAKRTDDTRVVVFLAGFDEFLSQFERLLKEDSQNGGGVVANHGHFGNLLRIGMVICCGAGSRTCPSKEDSNPNQRQATPDARLPL